jgi:hypothetical protein
MQKKFKNSLFMLRLLLFINAALICMIILMHSGSKQHINKKESDSCCAKKLGFDAVNSITIKLM